MTDAYAAGDTSTPLLTETIGDSLAGAAERHGDRDALVVPFQGIRLTYRELDAEVDRLGRALMALGLTEGERVGIWSPNNAEWVLTQFATARIGVILVNLNPAYRTEELRYALDQSGCRVLISAASFKTSDYAAMIDEVRPALDALEEVVLLGTDDWTELLARADETPLDALRDRAAGLEATEPINIQYTSGTTGFPKGATLSHRNILNNGYFLGETFGYTAIDRVCIPVPFYHCFGMVIGNLACVTHGAAMVVPAPAFEPGATLQTVQDEGCTSLLGVPTMFIAELGHPDFAPVRPLDVAYGDDGGVTVPGRGDEAVQRPHAPG